MDSEAFNKKIQELRGEVLDGTRPLSDVLRETKEVLHRGGHASDDFLLWLDNEIDGYKDELSVPEYRNAVGQLKCNNGVKIIDVFLENSKELPPKKIDSPISEIENLAKNGFRNNFNSKGQITLNNQFGDGVYFSQFQPGEVREILEAVKSRFLDKLRLISVYEASSSEDYNTEILHDALKGKSVELFNDGHYKNATEESFKVVKDKLRKLTGTEKGHEAFGKGLHIKGAPAPNVDEDFNSGVKFLTMATACFRNTIAHTAEDSIDKRQGFYYLVFASLTMSFLDNAEIKQKKTKNGTKN